MTSRYALALIAVLITVPSVASRTICQDGPACPDDVCDAVTTVRRNP